MLRSEKLYRFSTCSSHRYNEFWPIWLAPTALVGFLTCFLHLLNRQVELASRSDFLWQYKLSSEEEGVDTMRGINKILLENILPAHVAEHYLLGVQGVSGILQDSNVMLSFLHRTQARTHSIFGLKSRVLKLKFLA